MAALHLGAAQRPARGETVCGDAWASVRARDGSLLVCVADGLGHGPGAALAARAACEHACSHCDDSLEMMIRGLDPVLAHTRGAAVSLVRVDARGARLGFAGVGNVALRARSRVPIEPLTTPGIVGRRPARVRVSEHAVSEGDVIVVFTDGLSSRFDISTGAIASEADAVSAARALIEAHGKSHDDATCVVLRVGA